MGIVTKIYNLIIILRVLYWHGFLACFLYYFCGSGVDSHTAWAKKTYEYFKVNRHELPGSKPIASGKMMFFANHRSQADFFLHNVIMNHQTSFLSRMAVGILIPFFLSATSTLWFFNRSRNVDPEKFNQWLDSKFENSPRPALLAYPEGHRMQGSTKVDKSKVKTGMIRYAYRRKIKTQLLMTFGNQNIFDQKRLHVAWKQRVPKLVNQLISNSRRQSTLQITRSKNNLCRKSKTDSVSSSMKSTVNVRKRSPSRSLTDGKYGEIKQRNNFNLLPIKEQPQLIAHQIYQTIMAHTQNRFLIPELNIVANDAELKKMQKQILMQQYEKDIEEKQKRNKPREYLHISRDNPEYPLYRSQAHLDIEKNIKQDLAQVYAEEMERKEMARRHQKQQERYKEEMMIRRGKQIEQMDRIRVKEAHQTFKQEAFAQMNENEHKKMMEKKREQEEKQVYQRRYSTNLLSLSKEKSFKQHYQNVSGFQEENMRNYMSVVIPMNNERQREKERIVEEGIRRSSLQLREQLKNQYSSAMRYREELRDSLTQQIRQKEIKKKNELREERAQGYTSLNYQGRHHPINNPVDFKITHDNKYIIGELQSGLARSGSKSILQ